MGLCTGLLMPFRPDLTSTWGQQKSRNKKYLSDYTIGQVSFRKNLFDLVSYN
jgi:hypothetical protein